MDLSTIYRLLQLVIFSAFKGLRFYYIHIIYKTHRLIFNEFRSKLLFLMRTLQFFKVIFNNIQILKKIILSISKLDH